MRLQEQPRDVLVLGASGTIGQAATTALIARGARVHTPGRDMQWEPVHPWGLVSCFGDYGPHGKFAEQDVNANVKAMQLNLYAQMVQVQRFLQLLAGRPGRIVLMSGGGVGSGKHPEGRVAYVTAKAGLVGFVEALSQELTNVTINAVAPGPVKSKMTAGEKRDDWVKPELAAELAADIIMEDKIRFTGRLWSARKRIPFVLRSVGQATPSVPA